MIDWKVVAESGMHELQIKILEYVDANDEASPVEVTRLWYPKSAHKSMLSKVSYHFTCLRHRRLLKIDSTNRRRGAIENIHVLTARVKS